MTDLPERLSQALSDRYRIERELGAGGMATVYLAEDPRHHRKVAVKVLRPDLAASLGPERFLREVTIAANLQHPHILPLYDSGQVDGFLYYVMPYVEGISLRQKLAREGELPIPEAVRILRDVADAIAYAHQRGVVHRDIKPENVMLSGRHALVTDFGVAKAVSEATGRQTLTTAGVALGTPTYMAPEQAMADPHTDHRADLYAFGVVAYELLTGQPPFTGPSPQAVLAAHVTAAVEPVTRHRASIPPALAGMVMKCLEKKPADRWQSAEELLPQLEAVLTPSGGMTPTATQPIAAVPANPASRRRRTIGFLAVGGVLVFLGVAGWVLTRQTGRSAFSPEERGRSIGVLTFTLLAADSSYAYLAQGLSEDVSTALSGVSGLRVKAPSAVRRLQQASPADLESLGRNLGVNYLVDGSIRPLGEKLRVSVRLVTPEGEESSWAQTYDRAPTEMLDLPSDIARGIAAKLVGTDGTIAAQLRRSTTNPEAYDAYLKGNFHFTQRSEAALRLALASYQRALLLDSSFSAPRARIAMCYAQMLDYGWLPAGMTRSEVVALGQAVADTAVRRDSTSADAWVALGYLAMQQVPPDGRREVQAYERAIALDSSHLEAAMRLGFALILNGDYDAASQRLRQVLLLDQGFFTSYRALARIAALEGHLQHARALLDTAITLGPQSLPAFEDRAAINILLNDLAAAEQDLASVRRLQPHVGSRALVPMLEIAKGRPAAATDWLRANPEAPGEDRAAVLFALGRREEGVRILDEGRGTTLELIHARFWGLQSDSGFRAVLAEARRRENRSLR